MRLRMKGKGDETIVSMGWDEAQAALAAGTHEVAEGGGAPNGIAGNAAEIGDEAGPGVEVEGTTEAEIDLDELTRADLDALAEERGIDVSKAKTKADVIEALRAAP